MVTGQTQIECNRCTELKMEKKKTFQQWQQNFLPICEKQNFKTTYRQPCLLQMGSNQKPPTIQCKSFSKVLFRKGYPTKQGHMEDAMSIISDFLHHSLSAKPYLK